MATFFINLFTVALLFICAFVVLVVLMQRPSSNSGLGASLGGGAAESAFGGETTNVLTRWTIYSAVAFLVIAFGLYLGRMSHQSQEKDELRLPTMVSAPEAKPQSAGKLTQLPAAAPVQPNAQPLPQK